MMFIVGGSTYGSMFVTISSRTVVSLSVSKQPTVTVEVATIASYSRWNEV